MTQSKPVFALSYFKLLAGPLAFALILLAPIFPSDPKVGHTIAVASWILIWWISEAVPLPVTALLPLVLFPVLGILDMNATALNYANPTIFLYMSGFIFALAMEKQNLHLRIALHIVRFVGTDTNKIVLGFMLATAFISMWVNNTAAALMMLPIATSVLFLMEKEFLNQGLEADFKKFSISVLLGVAYSASIGGMTTIIGSPTNSVLITFYKQFYHTDISFAGWFIVGFPIAVVLQLAAYLIIVKLLFKVQVKSVPGTLEMLNTKIAGMKAMSTQEKTVSFVFLLTAIGWILRTPLTDWLGLHFLNDTLIGISGALLLFVLPDRSNATGRLLDWSVMHQLSWGILFLIGGGLALAKALENSGIIKMIGEAIASTGIGSGFFIVAMLVGLTLSFKQFIGNTALATIMLPLAFGIAGALKLNPILVGMPVTMACSCAYMLPMSTPPNAIVFTTGQVSIKDMMRAGALLLLVAAVLLIAVYKTYTWMLYGSIVTLTQ